MSDIRRKALQQARKKLAEQPLRDLRAWLVKLLGEPAVQAIEADADRRYQAEIKRLNIVEPAPLPRGVEPPLSKAGETYWNAVQQMQKKAPASREYKRVTKHKNPPKLLDLGGKLTLAKPSKTEALKLLCLNLVDAYEALSPEEKAQFSTECAPEFLGYRFPWPKAKAEFERALRNWRAFNEKAGPLRKQAEIDAGNAGIDKAMGVGTGSYKVGGKVSVGQSPETARENGGGNE